MPPYNAPTWKKLAKGYRREVQFGGSASEARITTAEQTMGLSFPPQLREFWLESDGLIGEYGDRVIWSVGHVEQENQKFRTMPAFKSLYMPFEHLLFFGDDCGGNLFAYAIQADGQIHKRDIFCWNHENDSRFWFAGHLEQYLEKRLKAEDEEDDEDA
jgi:hypothetical protein